MRSNTLKTRIRAGSESNLRSTTQLLRLYRTQAKRIHRNFVTAGPGKIRLLAFLYIFTLCSFLTYFFFKPSDSVTRTESDPLVAHVGTSSINIAPRKLVPLSGFASRKSPPSSTELLTPWAPLLVRALAVRFSNTSAVPRLVFVTLDVIGISRNFSDSVFTELFHRHGLLRQEVRLISSHTHSGPAISNTLTALLPDNTNASLISQYTDELRNAIIGVVGEALSRSSNAGPSYLYQKVGNIEIGVNRRQVEEQLFNERTDRGTVDSQLPVMWFRHATGNRAIIAGLYGMSAHATVLTTNNQYSGDYPSAVSTTLEARFPHSTWLYLPGFGGDINIYPRGTVDLLKLHRDIIVSEVRRVVETDRRLSRPIDSHVFSVKHTKLQLPFRTRLEYKDLLSYTRSKDRATRRSVERMLSEMRPDGKTAAAYESPITLWQIGTVKILFLGGEPTVGYTVTLRRDGCASWLVGYTDDVMGYIGTAQVLREKKREGSDRAALYYGLPCAWDPSVEALIISKVRNMSCT